MDAFLCEAQEGRIHWLRQVAPGDFRELTIAEDMRAPVRVETTDMDSDGDIDLLVSSMVRSFPTTTVLVPP
ncbi:FG-GAP repeat domain-containing protein [Pelagicoccus sp. SDUM812002]|uniref:FG-GAP repeat domain-containing protein n=1 Tax=Pelagicoccus sp. SDUM812002 TaxID=3041266 RepID=UPI0034E2ECB2